MHIDQSLELISLMIQLAELQVPLSEDLTRTHSQLMRLPTLRPRAELPGKLVGLTDAEMVDVFREFSIGVALEGSGGPGEAATERMRLALSTELAQAVLAVADDILDHLRPRFDTSAQAVHQATQLGTHPGTREVDILRSDNVLEMRDAWAELLGHSRTLGAIAMARIQISRAAGAPPAPSNRWTTEGPKESVEDIAGVMFREDGRVWRLDKEDGWQQWLRLNAGTPARLLSLDESVSALNLVRA